MSKATPRFLNAFVFMAFLGISILGQAQIENEKADMKQSVKVQWENLFLSANESAVVANGKPSFLRLQIPNVGEKSFSIVHDENASSFSIVDEAGLYLRIMRHDDWRIQSILMPNGETVRIEWKQNQSGGWIPVKFDCKIRAVNYIAEEGSACEDAAAAALIALGVCTVSPGSVGCWAATANAAYHTYRCYRETHPQMEALPTTMASFRETKKPILMERAWITRELHNY